ncbi:MAG: hypothetical protein IK061_04390, partial [Desulfovibrio sp.]|nr:hypothetical protein [Desulfovibrio sp.]
MADGRKINQFRGLTLLFDFEIFFGPAGRRGGRDRDAAQSFASAAGKTWTGACASRSSLHAG